MNKIWIFLSFLFVLTACDKTTYKLEGKWRIEEIKRANGTVEEVDDFFYNFQTTLFTYQVYVNDTSEGTRQYPGFRTMIDDDTMELEFAESSEFGTTPERSREAAGWSDTKRVFTIDKLSRNKLILSSEGETLTFRSY